MRRLIIKRTSGIACLAVLAVLFIGVKAAQAELIQFHFTGTITFVQVEFLGPFPHTFDDEFLGVSAGTRFSGIFAYELVTGSDQSGFYEQPPFDTRIGILATIGDVTLVPDGGTEIVVFDNFQGIDGFAIRDLNSHLFAPGEPPLGVTEAVISLVDATAALYSDTSMPRMLDLNEFTSGSLSLANLETGPAAFLVRGRIDSLTPVPEPGTLLLLGSGLVGMGTAARRRTRRK